jgi:hypothetical protein
MTRRLFASVAAALSVGVAAAAPVPKTAPPPAPKTGATVQLATAKVSGEMIVLTATTSQMVAVPVTETIVQNGQQITVTKYVTETRHVPVTMQMVLKGTKASTADGKEIAEDDLAKKLGEGGAVVQVPVGFDPEWRKLFADDVVFLEPNLNRGPGGGLLAPPVARPLPALPPPPIVEKK